MRLDNFNVSIEKNKDHFDVRVQRGPNDSSANIRPHQKVPIPCIKFSFKTKALSTVREQRKNRNVCIINLFTDKKGNIWSSSRESELICWYWHYFYVDLIYSIVNSL